MFKAHLCHLHLCYLLPVFAVPTCIDCRAVTRTFSWSVLTAVVHVNPDKLVLFWFILPLLQKMAPVRVWFKGCRSCYPTSIVMALEETQCTDVSHSHLIGVIVSAPLMDFSWRPIADFLQAAWHQRCISHFHFYENLVAANLGMRFAFWQLRAATSNSQQRIVSLRLTKLRPQRWRRECWCCCKYIIAF